MIGHISANQRSTPLGIYCICNDLVLVTKTWVAHIETDITNATLPSVCSCGETDSSERSVNWSCLIPSSESIPSVGGNGN